MRIWLFAIAISLGATACGGGKKSPKAPATDEEKADREDTGARDSSQPDDADDMPSQSSDDPMGDGGGGGD